LTHLGDVDLLIAETFNSCQHTSLNVLLLLWFRQFHFSSLSSVIVHLCSNLKIDYQHQDRIICWGDILKEEEKDFI